MPTPIRPAGKKPTTAARVPLPGTLRKYGLTEADWITLLVAQGGVCASCRKVPENGRLCTDHEHIPGWKKLPPEQRKLYVRGILCFWCNSSYCGRGITVEKAENIADYLRRYERRRPPRKRKDKL